MAETNAASPGKKKYKLFIPPSCGTFKSLPDPNAPKIVPLARLLSRFPTPKVNHKSSVPTLNEFVAKKMHLQFGRAQTSHSASHTKIIQRESSIFDTTAFSKTKYGTAHSSPANDTPNVDHDSKESLNDKPPISSPYQRKQSIFDSLSFGGQSTPVTPVQASRRPSYLELTSFRPSNESSRDAVHHSPSYHVDLQNAVYTHNILHQALEKDHLLNNTETYQSPKELNPENDFPPLEPRRKFSILRESIEEHRHKSTMTAAPTIPIIDETAEVPANAELSISAILLWIRLFRSQLLALRLAKVYKKILQNQIMSCKDVPMKEAVTLSLILKEIVVEQDAEYEHKVKSILDVPPEQRTKEKLDYLLRILTNKIPDFAKYPLSERMAFCKVMTFESYPPNSLLIKEGHVGTCLYFVFSGQIEVFKLQDGWKRRLNFMNAGKIFGDRILKNGDGKRTASVATTVATSLLRIAKADYLKCVEASDLSKRSLILGPLSQLPTFAGQSEFLEKILCFFKLYTYAEGHVIQEEGTQQLELNWLLEGSCKVVQNVPFVVKGKRTKGKTNLAPFVTEEDVQPGDKKVIIQLESQELLTGDSFPPIPVLGDYDNIKYLGASTIVKEDYVEFYAKLRIDDPRTYCTSSVIATSVVVVAAIQIMDFVQLAPKQILHSLSMNPSVCKSTLQEIQQQYIDQKMWEEQRKVMVEDFHVKKS